MANLTDPDDAPAYHVIGPRTGVYRVITPQVARVTILVVIGMLVILDLRTLIDRQTPFDGLLAALPWIADTIALVLIFLGLRGAAFIGFKRRPRPTYLKLLFGLALISLAFFAAAPHYHEKATYSANDGRYTMQLNGRHTELTASTYWSEVHASERAAIATNLIVMVLLLSVVEGRLGDWPPATEHEMAARATSSPT